MHNVELACIENEEPQMAIEERPPEHQLKSAENQQVLMIQEQHPIQIVQVINDQQQIFMEIMEQPKIEDIPIYLQSYETGKIIWCKF